MNRNHRVSVKHVPQGMQVRILPIPPRTLRKSRSLILENLCSSDGNFHRLVKVAGAFFRAYFHFCVLSSAQRKSTAIYRQGSLVQFQEDAPVMAFAITIPL